MAEEVLGTIDQQFLDKLHAASTEAAGAEAPALITPDYMSVLSQLFMSLLDGCFGGGTPGPAPTPASVAQGMKTASPFQRAGMQIKARRYYVQQGMTKKHGHIAAKAMLSAADQTSVADLTAVIDHAQSSFPQVDMF